MCLQRFILVFKSSIYFLFLAPGAIATLESFVNATFVRTKLVCQVNTSLVFELLSLEISVVRQGTRHLLAYINRSVTSLPV